MNLMVVVHVCEGPENLASDSGRTTMGVRRMGKLDTEPFIEAMKLKCDHEEAEEKASQLCSLWDEALKNVEQGNGTYRRVIDDSEDEKLQDLKTDLGDKVYEVVIAALREINEYNPGGGYITLELWNYKEKRKASLKEGIDYLLKMWNLHMDSGMVLA